MTEPLRPFHLALPVTDLHSAEAFDCGLLGFAKGRTASRWVDLNFTDTRLLCTLLMLSMQMLQQTLWMVTLYLHAILALFSICLTGNRSQHDLKKPVANF